MSGAAHEAPAVVVGAGAVGLALGARLARAGEAVRFVTRREQAAARIRREGVLAEDPATGERFEVPADATCELAADAPGPVLVCVRLPDLPALAARFGTRTCAVTFQNDVEAEDIAARYAGRVVGAVWRQTCTRTDDRSVRFTGRGRIVVGLHPEGHDPAVERLAARLRAAGFDVGVSARIHEDKWLKLCVNLMSTPNALVQRADHTREAFVEVKARLLEEAAAALAAAGIVARSCDGRDRDLAAEIRHQRASLVAGTSARPLPLYNQVWASLRHGSPLEAAGYHRRILALARRAGLTAPTNARVLEALERARRLGLGPESVAAEELLA
jgi:2-dehydropantoate 2-reductase